MTAPIRVLLVEDDTDDAALLSMRFIEHGYQATVARVDSEDGLVRALDRGRWDVVISDHRLPGFTSADALRLVRARQPEMPFVIVSGQIGEDLAVEALKAGADDYVMKDRLGRVVPAVERAIADRRLRQAERDSAEALRVAQAHLRWLVASSPVVVYETEASPGHELRFISENVRGLAGREAAELVGLSGCQWRAVHPDDAPALAQAVARLSQSGAPQRLAYRARHADGSYRWVQDDMRRAPGLEGRTAIVGALVDVTEHRALEEQLHRAQRMEAVGQLAGGVAHDSNNLLAVILGCSQEVLAAVAPDESHHASVLAIRRAAARGATVASRLLALSRRQVLKPRVRDLNELVTDIEPLLRPLFREGVALDVRGSATPQPVCVDESQMEQVVLNLAINARDATPPGGAVTVEVGRDASHVTLTVSDTGSGIEPDVLPRIFEPFFTTKAKGVGTGLGLAMVHGVVTQSGGQIDVESERGRGTRMTVRLPVAAEPAPAEAPAPPAAPRMPASRASVLLVDDDDLVRDLIRRTLAAAGHDVETADSGMDALRSHAEAGPVDVLVTDLTMPGLGGVELARRLAARQPDLRVLFVSGCADDVLPETPANEFLAKPFEAVDLLAAVDRLLTRPAAPADASP
ncbi:MAG: response regulator [Vicinamibacterales bacterium]